MLLSFCKHTWSRPFISIINASVRRCYISKFSSMFFFPLSTMRSTVWGHPLHSWFSCPEVICYGQSNRTLYQNQEIVLWLLSSEHLKFYVRTQGSRENLGAQFFCLLSAGCTKSLKNACVIRPIFCKQNVLSCAFCKLSSLRAWSKRWNISLIDYQIDFNIICWEQSK